MGGGDFLEKMVAGRVGGVIVVVAVRNTCYEGTCPLNLTSGVGTVDDSWK